MIRRIFMSMEHYLAIRNAMVNELNYKGIFTDDSLPKMMEKLNKLDRLEPERPKFTKPRKKSKKTGNIKKKKPNHYIHFESNFLVKEIKKRDPNFDTRGMKKTDLMKFLDMSLKGTSTFLGLLCKYKRFEYIPIRDMINLLSRYTKPFEVEADDLYYLLHLNKNIKRIVALVVRDFSTLSFKDISICLTAMNSLLNVFDRKYAFEIKSFPNKLLDYMLEKALTIVSTCNFQDLLRLIDSAYKLREHSISEPLRVLQDEMVKHPLIPQYLTNEELLLIVSNFPTSAISIDDQMVEKHIKMYEERLSDYCIGDKVDAFHGIQRSGYHISQKIIKTLDEVDKDYLSIQPQYKILTFFESLSNSGLLTQDLSYLLINWFEENMEITTESFHKIADMTYVVYSKGFGSFFMKEPNYLLRLMNPYAKMNLESILKFSIVFSRCLKNPEFFSLVWRTFKRIKDIYDTLPNVISLVIEMQTALLESCEEVPVFNYQLSSFETLLCKEKVELIKFVNKIIYDYRPNCPVILRFHSDFALAYKPEEDVFNYLNKKNIYYACKAIWRFKIEGETATDVLKSALKLINFENKTDTNILFYLSSCKPDPSLYDLKWVDTTSPYYLPLCYQLDLVPEITEELLTNIIQSPDVFGDVLFKTILIGIRNGVNTKFLKRITQNLTYEPKNYQQVDWESKVKLIKELISKKDSIDFYVFSVFVCKNFEYFSHEDLIQIFSFFQNHLDEVFFGLRENFCKVGLIQGKNQDFFYFPERNYRELDEITDDNKENLKILDGMIKKNVLNLKFLDSFIENLKSFQKQGSDILAESVKILDYLSLFGDFHNHLESIFSLLSNNSILHSLSKTDLVNLIFTKEFSSNSSPILQNFPVPIEKLKENPPSGLKRLSNGLLYYDPFTYNTQFEPRYVISCDSSINLYPSGYSEYFPVTREDFLSALKLFLVLEKFGIASSEETIQKINSYLIKISKSRLFSFSLVEIQTQQEKEFNLKFNEFYEMIEETPLTGISKILVTFNETNKAFLILDEEFFINNGEIGNEEVFLAKVFKMYIERVTGFQVTLFNSLNLRDKSKDPDHPFVLMSSKDYLEAFD